MSLIFCGFFILPHLICIETLGKRRTDIFQASFKSQVRCSVLSSNEIRHRFNPFILHLRNLIPYQMSKLPLATQSVSAEMCLKAPFLLCDVVLPHCTMVCIWPQSPGTGNLVPSGRMWEVGELTSSD
jgi:hypothetical protein